MDITIHHLVFYLKHDVSETVFCLLRVEPTEIGPINRANLLPVSADSLWHMMALSPRANYTD
jgi:hypothetical protein